LPTPNIVTAQYAQSFKFEDKSKSCPPTATPFLALVSVFLAFPHFNSSFSFFL